VTSDPTTPPGPSAGSASPVSDVDAPFVSDVDRLADDVAAIVLALPGVVDLHPGPLGSVATYLPGRRVVGVRLDAETVEVHVVIGLDRPVREVAQDIHRAVSAVVTSPVRVYVEDVAAPGDHDAA
jgi:hypothetical protein